MRATGAPQSQRRSNRAHELARGVAQPGLARHLGVVEVAGSNPVAPIFSALRPKKIESRWEKVESRKNQDRRGVSSQARHQSKTAIYFLSVSA